MEVAFLVSRFRLTPSNGGHAKKAFAKASVIAWPFVSLINIFTVVKEFCINTVLGDRAHWISAF